MQNQEIGFANDVPALVHEVSLVYHGNFFGHQALVTNNLKEFKQVEGLALENWIQGTSEL